MAFLFILHFMQIHTLYWYEVVLLLLFCSSIYLFRIKKIISFGFGILCAVTSVVALINIYQIYHSFFVIKEWDFLAFYMYGKLGAAGVNFYNPTDTEAVFSTFKVPFEISKYFYDEVIRVGLPYPPYTMILLAPFGYLNIETANILWKIFINSFLILDILLLIKIFKTDDSKWINILIILTFTLIFPSCVSTISFSQTNFLILFFILLIYKDPDNWKSGVYLALAVLVKPVAVIWCLYFIINKKWKPLITSIISGILILIISVILFGLKNYISYFTSPPTLRIPQFVYIEGLNQSLFANISRFFMKFGMDTFNVNLIMMTAILSVLLTVVACVVSYKLIKSNKRLSFLIFIPLSMLIYPGSLAYYSIFLLPLFFMIISKRNYMSLLLSGSILLLLFYSSFLTSFYLLLIITVYSFSNISNGHLFQSKSY